jgi:tetratricopeptide (TPR) repeat protein
LVEFCFNIGTNLNDAYEYDNRAIAKSELGDYHGSILDFDKEIELESDFENASLWRGEEKHKISDFTNVISDFNYSQKLNPNNEEAFLNLNRAKELGSKEADELRNNYR